MGGAPDFGLPGLSVFTRQKQVNTRLSQYNSLVIGFYFDGGFEQMIVAGQLDQQEIEHWGSLAVLFIHGFGDVSEFSEKQKEDAFNLLETLYIKLEADLMFDEIDKASIADVCCGASQSFDDRCPIAGKAFAEKFEA